MRLPGKGAWKINRGRTAMFARWPGHGIRSGSGPKAIHEGNGRCACSSDERANPQQSEALMKIAKRTGRRAPV